MKSLLIWGAGAVVTQNIPERAVAVGVPAKIMKSGKRLSLLLLI